MNNNPFDILKQKSGVAIMAVILFFLVMVIMLGGLSIFSNINLSNSTTTSKTAAAYYAAEAGINVETEAIVDLINDLVSSNVEESVLINDINDYISNNLDKTLTFDSNTGDPVQAIININNLGVIDGMIVLRVTSQGYVGSQLRTINKDISFMYVQGNNSDPTTIMIDKTVLTQQNITITNGTIIGNPVGTYSSNTGAVTISGGGRVPGVMIPQGTNKTDVVRVSNNNYNTFITGGGVDAITYLEEMYPFPSIVMPGYPDRSTLPFLPEHRIPGTWADLVNSSGVFNLVSWTTDAVYTIPTTHPVYYVPSMTIGGNTRFTIQVNDDVTLIVDRLNIVGAMQVVGQGTLTIYLTGNTEGTAVDNLADKFNYGYTGGNGHIGNIDHPERFKLLIDPLFIRQRIQGNVYESVPATFTIGGSSPLYMSLYAANISLNLSGSGKIDGYVVTGGPDISISGGSSTAVALYYAPNAAVSLTGGGSVRGAILANTFSMGGGASVTYNDVAFDNFPFALFDFSPDEGGNTSVFELVIGSTKEN